MFPKQVFPFPSLKSLELYFVTPPDSDFRPPHPPLKSEVKFINLVDVLAPQDELLNFYEWKCHDMPLYVYCFFIYQTLCSYWLIYENWKKFSRFLTPAL